MVFRADKKDFESELKNVARMFVPFFLDGIDIDISLDNGKILCIIDQKTYKFKPKSVQIETLLTEYKIALYKALSRFYKTRLPWGSLTGIRPTRIAYKLLNEGKSLKFATKTLKRKYLVSAPKADLVKKIVNNQENLLFNCQNYINIYIHIPFCPSRCSYCSFISLDANKFKPLIEPYLDTLIKEIELIKPFINKKILSVYIGGGTPTALSVEQLYKLLKAIETLGANNVEYTVEAGRPDTIDVEKLIVLKRFGVTRVCINPQTFNENTLRAMGRNHTIESISLGIELSRKFDFDINTDLIAGLEGEKFDDFVNSLNSTLRLNPDNITIHTLSIKNGSKLFNSKRKFNPFTAQMTEYAQKTLIKSGYAPYYLYRQKNMSANLENIGYSLKGKQSIFNITSMEETVSVLAVGAGSITKLVGQSIERFANLRDVSLYINDFDTLTQKKLKFLADKN